MTQNIPLGKVSLTYEHLKTYVSENIIAETPVFHEQLASKLNTIIIELSRILNVHVPQPDYIRISFHETHKPIRVKSKLLYPPPILIYFPQEKETPDIHRISIRFDVYNNQLLRNTCLLYEAFKYVFYHLSESTYIPKQSLAEKLSLTFLMGLLTNTHVKIFLKKAWHEISPPIQVTPTYIYTVKRYVFNIYDVLKKKYLFSLLEVILANKKMNENDFFRLSVSPQLLNSTERAVYIHVIENNSVSIKQLHASLSLSSRHTARIISKLQGLYLIRSRWQLDLNALSLNSMFLAVSLPREKKSFLKNVKSPYLRGMFLFPSPPNNLFFLLNYYFPNHRYAQHVIQEWIKEHEQYSQTSSNFNLLFWGNELLHYRSYIQQPRLLFQEIETTREHTKSDNSNERVLISLRSQKRPLDKNLTGRHRGLSLLFFKYNFKNFEQLYNHVRTLPTSDVEKLFLTKNRKSLHTTYAELLGNHILTRRIVMPFFENQELLLVTAQLRSNLKENYETFLKTIMPYSLVANTGVLEDHRVLSFVSIKKPVVQKFIENVNHYFPQAVIYQNPNSLESTPILDLKVSKNGWKFNKPQLIYPFFK